jgi:hypothetical protein
MKHALIGLAALAVLASGAWVLAGLPRSRAADEDVIHLFNGKDLTNFYTYLVAPSKDAKPYGKNNDPEQVFTVHDGMIHVSGKVFGGLITDQEYGNYHLIAEFKWGEKTWPPRENAARDSGILLHCTGEDGGFGPWMESFECQMIEGGTADLLILGKKEKRSLTVEAEKRGGQYYYKVGAPAVTLESGRFNWYARDPNWKDVKGFRGEHDLEKPVGEWNTLECICDGDKITNILNGTVANAATKASHTKGKILFQSEGAEVFFRKIDLRPIKK